jgi:16S rRNA (uracil1498-N3)-methyltransferase
MPANDRMDWLVEKATELGVASIQPLMSERSVLRLKDERATKKQAHWQAVAVSACEQCGGNRVPVVHAVQTLDAWLRASPLPEGCKRAVLSLSAGSQPLPQVWAGWAARSGKGADRQPNEPNGPDELGRPQVAVVLGPEGGWSPAEEQALLSAGATPVSLGPRVLRSETAAVASLAMLASLSLG